MIRREPAQGWPPSPRTLWIVDGTAIAVAGVNEIDTGEVTMRVLLRIGSTLNHDGATDDRTYVLDLDIASGLIGALMGASRVAFGAGTVMTAMADHLGVDPTDRDRGMAAMDEALNRLRDE